MQSVVVRIHEVPRDGTPKARWSGTRTSPRELNVQAQRHEITVELGKRRVACHSMKRLGLNPPFDPHSIVRQLLSIALLHDQDVVTARQRAAVLAGLTGFEPAEQTRFATAVSEIVRNAWTYARGGEVAYGIDEESAPQALVVQVTDRGPGIRHLDEVLAGRVVSTSGSGAGIMSARRLLDGFEMRSSTAGTRS